MGKKKPTLKEQKHMEKVASIGCIACRKLGIYDSPAEIHHIKNFTGAGKRSSHLLVLPLCPNHHRNSNESYHHSPKKFEDRFGNQIKLLEEVLDLLGSINP
tara:strand:+ start:523 stop:825 length:303 start_codon:yes stop_codon:yes gene_type:complete